jgi:hypothetical protein
MILNRTQTILKSSLEREKEYCRDARLKIDRSELPNDLDSYYWSVKFPLRRRVNEREELPSIASDSTLSPVEQLFFDQAVRLPLQPMTPLEFEKRYRITPDAMYELTNLGLVVPTIRRRQLEAWSTELPHLDRLLERACSPGDRYEAFLKHECEIKRMDYDDIERRVQKKLTEVVDQSVVDAVARYEGLNSKDPASLIASYTNRLLGMIIESPTIGWECLDMLGNTPATAAEALPQVRASVESTIAPRVGVMNGVVCLDQDNYHMHTDFPIIKAQPLARGKHQRLENGLLSIFLNAKPWPVFGAAEYSLRDQRSLVKLLDHLSADESYEQRTSLKKLFEELTTKVEAGELDESKEAALLRRHNEVVAEIERGGKRISTYLSLLGRLPTLLITGPTGAIGSLAKAVTSETTSKLSPSLEKALLTWDKSARGVTHRLIAEATAIRRAALE